MSADLKLFLGGSLVKGAILSGEFSGAIVEGMLGSLGLDIEDFL